MEIKAKIADLNVCFKHIHPEYFLDLYSDYLSDFSQADLDLIITKNYLTVPNGRVISADGTVKHLKHDDNSKEYIKYNKDKSIMYSIYHNSDYSLIRTYLDKNYHIDGFTFENIEYIVATICFNMKLIHSGGMMFHSSCIDFDGDAICFSAPSGTGKSTHTLLWKQVFGSRVKYINDDKPAIRFDEYGKAYAYGLPYSGKAYINNNTCAPVKAVVFIERAEENSIRKIGIQEATFRILDQTIKNNYDTDSLDVLISTVEKFILSVPCYLLSCNQSEDAVKTCYNELYKK